MAGKEKAKKKEEGASTRRSLTENWKSMVAQGAVALAVGVVIVAVPQLTARVVSFLLGGMLIVYGILSLVSARSAAADSQPATWLYLRGGVAAAGGILVLAWPGIQALTLLYALAIFAIAAGVFVVVSGLLQKWDKAYKLISSLGGLISTAFGVVLISSAGGFSERIVGITGVYAIAFGVLMILMGMGAREVSGGNG